LYSWLKGSVSIAFNPPILAISQQHIAPRMPTMSRAMLSPQAGFAGLLIFRLVKL
jgi:hypothetical protein